jgi:hypothetical protein
MIVTFGIGADVQIPIIYGHIRYISYRIVTVIIVHRDVRFVNQLFCAPLFHRLINDSADNAVVAYHDIAHGLF